jgi:hypothetical protein
MWENNLRNKTVSSWSFYFTDKFLLTKWIWACYVWIQSYNIYDGRVWRLLQSLTQVGILPWLSKQLRETCTPGYRSSFYTHKVCTHNLIKWTVSEQNSHLCLQSSYIFWKAGCNRNIPAAPPKKQTTVSLGLIVMLAPNQCTRKFTLYMTLVLNVCRHGIKQSGGGSHSYTIWMFFETFSLDQMRSTTPEL